MFATTTKQKTGEDVIAEKVIEELTAAVDTALLSEQGLHEAWKNASTVWEGLTGDERKEWELQVREVISRVRLSVELRRELKWTDGMSQTSRAQMLHVGVGTVNSDYQAIFTPENAPRSASNAGRPRIGVAASTDEDEVDEVETLPPNPRKSVRISRDTSPEAVVERLEATFGIPWITELADVLETRIGQEQDNAG